jgi:hypothetical protein
MAVKAPKVQSLSEIMASLNPAYKGQRSVINQEIAAVPQDQATQMAALDAAKGQGFNDINTQAASRGLAFSGVPLSEQSRYLSTKYLPAVADLKKASTEQKTSLQKALASLYSNEYNKAFSTRQSQQSDLNSWNKQVESEQARAKAAAKLRAFKAAQAAKQHNWDIREAKAQRAFKASQAAASRAARRASAGPSNAQIINKLNDYAHKHWGGDKKLSPSDFKAGYQVAARYGMSADDYAAIMQKYVNGHHAKDYVI